MYLGIDIGSTALKAALFDARRGRLVAQAGHRLPLATDATGKREQDPAALLRALRAVTASLRRQTGRGWQRVAGIGFAAQGGSTILVDRDTGAARTPMYLWNDTRALAYFHQTAAKHPASWWRSFSLRDEPGMGLARAQWLRERQPRLFAGNPLCVGAGEFGGFHLTGQWQQDACHALQSGVYDARRNRLTDRSLVELGLRADFAAPLREGHATAPLSAAGARLLQLPAGIPVAGPYNDHEAGYLSVRHVSRRPLECSLGTAWVGNFILPPGLAGRSPFQLVIASPAGRGQLVIMPLLTGNVTWDWALTTFLRADHRRALARTEKVFADRILPSEGLVALPWLNRPNALRPELNGSAAFFGLGPATSSDELLRALAAAMVFEFARVFAPVAAAGAIDSLVLCGGASRAAHFQALFAALFPSQPVRQVVEADLMGARGCLQAFDTPAAEAATRPVRPAVRLARAALAGARALYQDTFVRLYGHVAAGKPYALTREKRA